MFARALCVLCAMLLVGASMAACSKDKEEQETEATAEAEATVEAEPEQAEELPVPQPSRPQTRPNSDVAKRAVNARAVPGAGADEPMGKPAADPGADPDRRRRPPQGRTVSVSASSLNVSQMLDKQDIREATGYTGLVEVAELSGQAPSKQYNATRWQAEKGDFGFALEVWKPGSAGAATKQFEQLFAQSLGGERGRDVGDQSFQTEHHGLRTLVYLDRRRSAVAAVTCSEKLCTFDQLAELSRRIQVRL